MIVTHVYKPFVTVRHTDWETEEGRRYAILRFGVDAEDAAKSAYSYLYTMKEREHEPWEAFVRRNAKNFLNVNFREA